MTPAADVRNGLPDMATASASYPAKPLNGNPIYLPPAGFVEVTKKNRDDKLTPHFTLEAVPLQGRSRAIAIPKVRRRRRSGCCSKLEAILQHVNDDLGIKTDTLHVMSAFRTPYYNKAIGDVLYSQHQWGSAADIFIDPHDEEPHGGSRRQPHRRHRRCEVPLRPDRGHARRRRRSSASRAAWATTRQPARIRRSSTSDVRGTKAALAGMNAKSWPPSCRSWLRRSRCRRQRTRTRCSAHEANIDAVWESAIQPLLQRRYPGITRQQLIEARAYMRTAAR